MSTEGMMLGPTPLTKGGIKLSTPTTTNPNQPMGIPWRGQTPLPITLRLHLGPTASI